MIFRHFLTPVRAVAYACAVFASSSLHAAPDPSRACDLAAATAAKRSGVPIDILLAITRVETGRGGADPWPWTINAEGQGYRFDSKDAAILAAKDHLTDGINSFDIGCFQLNLRWHGDNFADLSDMFDPTQNADYAASFLMQLYDESGDWAAAVSAYHSRTADLADAYLDRVRAVLNDPTATKPMPEPEPRENLFPLLQAGGQGGAGSLFPMQMARGPLVGG